MTGTWNGEPVTFRTAGIDETADVLGVLDEAAGWLRTRGVSQWPARFEPGWVTGAIGRNETWLVRVGDRVAATFTLDWSDPLWNDIGGNAGYLHRSAVRRSTAGLGTLLLAWAGDTVRRHGRDALRLDCVATNRRLRDYYESAGFLHRGDVTVGGAPGQRRKDGPTTPVSRYELPLKANHEPPLETADRRPAAPR
ncbi:GNAT family N-acetyltransferase [Plantactinospora sonchi]|uniref:GNAT family N-acetyltransferase n=1 Tax=Plantactinospora sonchi TaxID=1544735 RepID=A0ABU7RPH2_9ACTN